MQYGPCFCTYGWVQQYIVNFLSDLLPWLIISPMTFPISSLSIPPWYLSFEKPYLNDWVVTYRHIYIVNYLRKLISRCVARRTFEDSSLRLCCLRQISTQLFISEQFNRSITYYDTLGKYSLSSPDIVRSLHFVCETDRRSCLILTLGQNIPKWIFFSFSRLCLYLPPPHV